MKITLKKVIYVGAGLLVALFFFLSLALTLKVKYGPGVLSYELNASFISAVSGKPFDPVFQNTFLSTTPTAADAYKIWLDAMNGTFAALATIGLILFILMIVALIGAFFIPSMKGARGLTIPFFALSILYYPIAIIVMGALLNVSKTSSAYGITLKLAFSECNFGACLIMYVVAVLLFIGMLIGSGVVQEKVLVGKKD